MNIAIAPPLAVPATEPPPGPEVSFEIIDGHWVEMPPMSAYAGLLASRLVGKVNEFAGPRDLGEAVIEVLFHLRLPQDRNRRPDGAFISYERWPKGQPMRARDNAWDVVPDLAIEVVSPSDFAEDLLEKIDEYFRAGVELVWVVYPLRAIVQVYESLTQIRGLLRHDELDGGKVLAGFRLPLTGLFQEGTAPS